MIIELELDEPAAEALFELERSTGMGRSRIFSYAVSLMLWCIRQRIAGRVVASVDESQQSYRQLKIEALGQQQEQNRNQAA